MFVLFIVCHMSFKNLASVHDLRKKREGGSCCEMLLLGQVRGGENGHRQRHALAYSQAPAVECGVQVGACELERMGGGGGGVRVQTAFWSFEKRSWKARPGRGEVRREQCALCPKARELPAHTGGRACCIEWTEPAGREVVMRWWCALPWGRGDPHMPPFLGVLGVLARVMKSRFYILDILFILFIVY